LTKNGYPEYSNGRQYYIDWSDRTGQTPYSGFLSHANSGQMYLGSWPLSDSPILAVKGSGSSVCKTKPTGYSMSGTEEVNSPVTFTVNAKNSCNDTLYYRYSCHPDYGTDGYDGFNWISMTTPEYVTDNSIAYTFDKAGKYIVVVWITTDPNNVNPEGIPIVGFSVEIDETGEEPYFPF